MSIRLYPPDANKSSSRFYYPKINGSYDRTVTLQGMCELSPSSCIIRESAGGDYTLTMKHPYDPQGKWLMLAEDYIICAPVPKQDYPTVEISPVDAYYIKRSGDVFIQQTPLYKNVMTPAKQENWNYLLWAAYLKNSSNPKYKWSKKKEYKAGDHVLKGSPPTSIYIAQEDTEKGEDPTGTYDPSTDNPWTADGYLGDSDHPNPFGDATLDDAEVITQIGRDDYFFKIADFDMGYMYGYTDYANGVFGFVRRSDFDSVTMAMDNAIIPGGTIEEQDFRIFKIEYDDAAKMVTVEAKHISYDMRRSGLMHCTVENEPPKTAVAKIIGKTVDTSQNLCIYTDIEGSDYSENGIDIDADWSWINPVQALLDPESGLAGITRAKVIRDNNVFYLLEDKDNDHGFVVQYGKNLLGVKLTRNTDEVVTRVIPFADDGQNGYLFLSDSMCVDSTELNKYPFPRIEMLQSEYYVGQEIEKADGSTSTMSVSSVRNKMRKEARNRFKVDKADHEKVSLEIDFLMLGDTEEYKQFRGLEHLQMYDTVKVISGDSAVVTEAQMSGYEYDAILKRYNKISLGTIYDMKRGKVASYMIAPGGVNFSNLASGLLHKITRG